MLTDDGVHDKWLFNFLILIFDPKLVSLFIHFPVKLARIFKYICKLLGQNGYLKLIQKLTWLEIKKNLIIGPGQPS